MIKPIVVNVKIPSISEISKVVVDADKVIAFHLHDPSTVVLRMVDGSCYYMERSDFFLKMGIIDNSL